MIRGSRDEVIRELFDAAQAAPRPDLAIYGAYRLLSDFDTALAGPRLVQLRDASLEYMRSLGFASGHLNMHVRGRSMDRAARRPASELGRNDRCRRSFPPVGSRRQAPRPGRVTADRPHRAHAGGKRVLRRASRRRSYIVFSERPRSSDDPTRGRYDDANLGTFTSLPGLLRAVARSSGRGPIGPKTSSSRTFPAAAPSGPRHAHPCSGHAAAVPPIEERSRMTEDRYCPKCKKTVRMTRCEVCKGRGSTPMSQCRSACNMHGWLCPVHGKNY